MNFDPISRPYCGAAHRAMSDLRALYFTQSSLTKDGEVATIDQARDAQRTCALAGLLDEAEQYATEQSPQEPITNYADRRGI